MDEFRAHLAVQDDLQAVGVPAAAVLDVGELLANPHVLARHGFEYVTVPNVGPTPYPRPAFILTRTPVPLETPAPAFAQDNVSVFRDLASLDSQAIASLEAQRITSPVPLGSGH